MSISGDERFQDKPNKNKFSHPHDALQYGAMKFAAERVIDAKKKEQSKIEMYNPVLRIF
jgi:hypothetical protein